MNGLSLLKSAKKRFANKDNKSSKKNQLRWTPKKKDKDKDQTEEDKNKRDPDIIYDNHYQYGPSQMYTVPRKVPKSHSHIIGPTAAVGTANSYSRYKNQSLSGSSARPYLSARKGGGYDGLVPKLKLMVIIKMNYQLHPLDLKQVMFDLYFLSRLFANNMIIFIILWILDWIYILLMLFVSEIRFFFFFKETTTT